jgi:hypothetical protein
VAGSAGHGLGIKTGASRFDEFIEAVLSQQLIQPSIEGMTCSRPAPSIGAIRIKYSISSLS